MPWMQSLWRSLKLTAIPFSRIVLYLLILFSVLSGFGWLKAYLVGPDISVATLYRVKPVATVVRETKESVKIKEVKVEVPVYIKQPDQEQKDKLEKKYEGAGLDLDLNKLLGEFLIPKSPYGADAVVTLKPDGHVEVTAKPKARPFFEFGGSRAIGGGVGYTNWGQSWRLFYEQDILRVGPVWFSGEASFGDPGNGKAHWRVEAQAKVRF